MRVHREYCREGRRVRPLPAQRARCRSDVFHVSEGQRTAGYGLERPGTRRGVKSSPTRWPTESLQSSTTLPWIELALTPNARIHFSRAGWRSDRGSERSGRHALRRAASPRSFRFSTVLALSRTLRAGSAGAALAAASLTATVRGALPESRSGRKDGPSDRTKGWFLLIEQAAPRLCPTCGNPRA